MPTVSISLMLAVHNAAAAAEWYKRALGAEELWNFGGVVGLTVEGAPFFLGEPANNGWNTPADAGTRTARVELLGMNGAMRSHNAADQSHLRRPSARCRRQSRGPQRSIPNRPLRR